MAITAQGIVDRIQQKFGSSWTDTPTDAFVAGNGEDEGMNYFGQWLKPLAPEVLVQFIATIADEFWTV